MSGIYENPSIYDRFWFSSHRDDANESVMTSDGGSESGLLFLFSPGRFLATNELKTIVLVRFHV